MVVAQQSIKIGIGAGAAWSKGDIELKVDGEIIELDNKETPFVLTAMAYIPVEFVVSNSFSVQPELMFSQHRIRENSETNEPDYSDKSTFTYTFNNLEVPILAKWSLGSSETFKFNIFAGPSFGFNMSGNVKTQSEGIEGGNPYKEEYEGKVKFLKDDFDGNEAFADNFNDFPGKRFNVNIHAGLGVTFVVGSANLFVNGRFVQGISDLFPDGLYDDFNGGKQKVEYNGRTTRIGFSAGVMFPLGGGSK